MSLIARVALSGLTMFLISVLFASVSEPSENALHCSKTLKKVTSTALDALLPLNPTKFCLVSLKLIYTPQSRRTYHRHNPISFHELAQVLPKLQGEHLPWNTTSRETILHDQAPLGEFWHPIFTWLLLSRKFRQVMDVCRA
jgi:hypothetical protein